MLQNWLNPTSVALRKATDYRLGAVIRFFQKDTDFDIKDASVAIIGVGAEEADRVREHLYRMSNHFSSLSIVDLGNFKKEEIAFIIPLLKELQESGIIPVIIGNDMNYFKAQYRSFKFLKEAINVSIVDRTIQISPSESKEFPYYLDDVFYEVHENIFHLDIIGHQIHYTDSAPISVLKKHHFDTLRLGTAKADMTLTEPIIRDADLFTFHLAALKQAVAPAQDQPSSSGFSSEEACRLCRYAGMSDKLRSFAILGYKEMNIAHDPTPETIAQMVWYFLFGVYHRKNDFPVSTAGMLEYVVQTQDHTFTFWKSTKSDRWWIQLSIKKTSKNKRHRLIPCTYEDYQKACNGQISDRLIKAIRRFSFRG